MEKKAIITIAGKPGSGKSTTANIVAETLGYERYSAGKFLRDIAARRGISIVEASEIAKTDPSIDHEMDEIVKQTGKEHDHMVIDGRLAFHFIPESFKVYLDLPLEVSAERIFNAKQNDRKEEMGASVEETLKNLRARFASEQARYENLYGIDPRDPKHFDIVIDTSAIPAEDVAKKIIEAYEAWRVS